MPRFGRREAAREVEKVEKGARTLKRRLLDDDEKNAPSVATTKSQHVARKLVIGAAFVYLAHRAWPRVRQDGGRAIRALKRSLGGLNPLKGRRGRGRKGRRRRGNDADAPHPSVDGAPTRTSREEAVEKISRAARARSPEASPSGVHRTLPAAVSDSSKSIAALRSLEEDARRPLFDDPFAAALAGPDAVARVRARNGDKGRIAIRTRFFDDAVLDALEGGGHDPTTYHTGDWQVVLLGAGLDTRAWRLAPRPASGEHGGERDHRCRAVFEVDVPEVSSHKSRVMAREFGDDFPLSLARTHVAVHANLASKGWARKLADAGHDPNRPTVWVLEGLLYYLAPDVVDRVLRECRACSASGSRLVASAVNRASLRRAREGGKKGGAKATWASCVDDPAGEFDTRGWDVVTIAQPGERGCEYGRWGGDPPLPREPGEHPDDAPPRTWYVVCEAGRPGWDSSPENPIARSRDGGTEKEARGERRRSRSPASARDTSQTTSSGGERTSSRTSSGTSSRDERASPRFEREGEGDDLSRFDETFEPERSRREEPASTSRREHRTRDPPRGSSRRGRPGADDEPREPEGRREPRREPERREPGREPEPARRGFFSRRDERKPPEHPTSRDDAPRVYERAPEPAETSESEPESETSLRSRDYEPPREKIERRYSSGQASARSSGGIRGSTRQDSAFGSYGDVTSPSKVVSVAASAAARLREIEADRTRRRAAEEESELRRRAREIADRTRHRREEDEERKRQRAAAAAASEAAAEGAAGGGGSAKPKPAPTAAKIVSGAVIHSSRLDFRRPVASVDARAGEILRDDPDLPKLSALTDAQFTRWRERTRDDWDLFGDDSNSSKSRDQSPATCVFDVFERSSGAMIGVAGFHVLDLDAKRAYLVVVIDGDRRRRGYGRECWETVSKFAKSDLAYHLGVETVCARVPAGNEPALFFVKDTRGFASPFSSPTGRGGGVNAQVFRRRTLATQAGKTPGLKRSLDDPAAPVFGVNVSEVGTCQTFYLDVRYWGGGAA